MSTIVVQHIDYKRKISFGFVDASKGTKICFFLFQLDTSILLETNKKNESIKKKKNQFSKTISVNTFNIICFQKENHDFALKLVKKLF